MQETKRSKINFPYTYRIAETEGFSTLEAVIAIAIISIAGLALFNGMTTAITAIQREQMVVRTNEAVINADTVIRREIGTVLIPFWQRSEKIKSGEELLLPWYEGIYNRQLDFVQKSDGLYIDIIVPKKTEQDRQTIYCIRNCTQFSYTVRTGKNHIPWGVNVQYRIGKKIYTTVAAFGSCPLSEEN